MIPNIEFIIKIRISKIIVNIFLVIVHILKINIIPSLCTTVGLLMDGGRDLTWGICGGSKPGCVARVAVNKVVVQI